MHVVVFDTSANAWAFSSPSEAERWLEATDVVDGEFHGYDAHGNRLAITAHGEEVSVVPTDDNAYGAAVEDLQRAARDNGEPVAGDSLEEMIRSLVVPPSASLWMRLRRFLGRPNPGAPPD